MEAMDRTVDVYNKNMIGEGLFLFLGSDYCGFLFLFVVVVFISLGK